MVIQLWRTSVVIVEQSSLDKAYLIVEQFAFHWSIGCCFGLEGPFFEDISLPTWIPKGLLFWKSFGLRWAFLFPPWPPHNLDWLSQACHPSLSLFLPSGLLKYNLFTKEASHFYPSIHLINCSFGDTTNKVKHWAGQASSRISAPRISEDSPSESIWLIIFLYCPTDLLGTNIMGLVDHARNEMFSVPLFWTPDKTNGEQSDKRMSNVRVIREY